MWSMRRGEGKESYQPSEEVRPHRLRGTRSKREMDIYIYIYIYTVYIYTAREREREREREAHTAGCHRGGVGGKRGG